MNPINLIACWNLTSRRFFPVLLFPVLLVAFMACDVLDTGSNPAQTYRALGDLTVTAWGRAVAPDGDLLIAATGRIYRWKIASQTWVNVPRDGLPDTVLGVDVNGAGDYIAFATTGELYSLAASQSTWSTVALHDPSFKLNTARFGADGSLYTVTSGGNVSRIDKKAIGATSWTAVFNNQGSTVRIANIEHAYANGDLWVSGTNLAGKYVLKAGKTMLETGLDCSGDAVRPYCEQGDLGRSVFAPNGDLYLTYGGLGSRGVYKASGSSFPLAVKSVGTLPNGLVNLTALAALNDGTLLGFGEQGTNHLFRLRSGASAWQDLGERPADPAYVTMIANTQGNVFFSGRQCCYAALRVYQLAR